MGASFVPDQFKKYIYLHFTICDAPADDEHSKILRPGIETRSDEEANPSNRHCYLASIGTGEMTGRKTGK